jgi:hypothetical protein
MSRVRAGFFSLTPPAPPDDDGSYLRWHLLDHMPEQYSLPGIVHALRWNADGDYPAHRLVAEGDLKEVGGVVNYLFADPVQQTYDDFMALGGKLADVGRFPERRPSLQVRLLELISDTAAPRVLVSPEVVPFRPHRGVLLIVEQPTGDEAVWRQWLTDQHLPELLEVPGVAGAWTFRSSEEWTLLPICAGEPQYTTVVFLDEDPLATTRAATSFIEARWASGAVRPMFAGPLRTMMQWDAWPE